MGTAVGPTLAAQPAASRAPLVVGLAARAARACAHVAALSDRGRDREAGADGAADRCSVARPGGRDRRVVGPPVRPQTRPLTGPLSRSFGRSSATRFSTGGPALRQTAGVVARAALGGHPQAGQNLGGIRQFFGRDWRAKVV